ncbi:MAG: twin-arginine translocase TatA/TatE family subunit [Chthonomonadales bacterium]
MPEMMRGLGSGVKEFKKGIKEDEDVPAEKPKEEEKKP